MATRRSGISQAQHSTTRADRLDPLWQLYHQDGDYYSVRLDEPLPNIGLFRGDILFCTQRQPEKGQLVVLSVFESSSRVGVGRYVEHSPRGVRLKTANGDVFTVRVRTLVAVDELYINLKVTGNRERLECEVTPFVYEQ